MFTANTKQMLSVVRIDVHVGLAYGHGHQSLQGTAATILQRAP